jgi:sigma-B regulation protein RsbU (phosphoserine phosphatase)
VSRPAAGVHTDAAILVVDDTEENRDMLVRRLARAGYRLVVVAVDGHEALARLDAQPFDLVLLDILMPGMDGYEVLERIKHDPRLRDVPVIMISALDDLDSVVRCVTLGAEDYLPKPFNPTLLNARIGATLEKKRLRDEIVAARDRLERELMAARTVQLAMVPAEFPPADARRTVEIFGTLQPAREVGADLYDFFWRDATTLRFVVADVSDKGAPAALFMARTRTLIRLTVTLTAAAGTPAPDLREIVRLVNAELSAGNEAMTFVTLVLGLLDVETGVVRFCNAGHPPPFVLRPDGALDRLDVEAPQPPLGIDDDAAYTMVERRLEPGDTLFVYTDGVTETVDAQDTLFGDARLEQALRGLAAAGVTAELAVAAVLDATRKFAGATAAADDIAALALRFRPPAPRGT